MKTIEKRQSTQFYDACIGITCDLCGISNPKGDWKADSSDAMEISVSMTEGNGWPDGGNGTKTEIDICPKCFKEKLIPLVLQNGGTPTVTEWDF